ncbi:mRNA cleavage and polyadenylation factor IA/II complex [Cucurbitaria berberidis CBS 394.84]|uniref:Polynucleotide 5'-hydroxyl-kinase GRC3 n=1 Tax=Cucurbitaria berberidis CBS 394.84 TaxID=1168544 RepID=A0A9P4GJ55_9PLEO|nr:mRNA cleavage and polyadenylation factor IA/II complex [Cucurbitaria berberidis CBS 394.84]KAF1846602.1 mRNA cleavage and polyadenylation factor IA/II complex [Cucurbitaria berberidis CBS 394.84]
MISLPGLNLASQPIEPLNVPTSTATRTQDLSANTEYRFEVSFSRTLTVKLQSGTAEFFGTELAPATTYTFQGTKGAIFTWHGCKLEIGGEVESDYVAEETPMMSCANLHFALENLRDKSVSSGSVEMGPRVLVVGPENSGKTSLIKTMTSYAVKSGRQPMVVNLDPRQGMLSVPGSFSAAAYSSIVDIEEGWGSSPISGPSPIPVKMPLVYHYGLKDPEEGKAFKPLVTRMALAVTSRLEEDNASKQAGFIIDSSGAISQGKNGVYENIEHIVSEFSVNVLITLGSERLYSDLARKFSNQVRDPSESVSVIRLEKSGGCVDRSEEYMKALRHAQIREYFFGKGDETLAPSSQMADFGDLNLFKLVQESDNAEYRPGDYDASSSPIYEKITPSAALQNKLLAITTASPNERQEVIRDSSIRGYIYVADVDEAKKKVKLLSPQPGQTPGNAMVLGSWPEDIPGLVS